MTDAPDLPARNPLVGLIARIFAWLPLAFAAWYFAAPLLFWPAAVIVELVARAGFADLVRGVEQTGATLVFATSLKPGVTAPGSPQLTVDVDMLLYAFGLPLYAALVLAAREPGRWRRMIIGYAVLLPIVAGGALADFLKTVAIAARPMVASQTGFSAGSAS